MSGEGKTTDYKLKFEPANAKQKLALVKDLIAIANSGGGQITVGRDETNIPGITEETTKALDSAKLSDFMQRYISPAQVDISHSVKKLKNGRYLAIIDIDAVDVPLVMARDGLWKGADPKKDKPLFLKGDIWVRHSSKTERISYEDLRRWIGLARRAEREQVLDRITTLVNLPEGTSLEVVSPSGLAIDSPRRLLESVARRRERDPDHLLDAEDLLWVFIQREGIELTESDLEILIASALRRSATLFWWLAEADEDPELVKQQLLATVDAADRDKSDAASRLTEVAAVYADRQTSQKLVSELGKSNYKHFRSAAKAWPGKRKAKKEFADRVNNARYEERSLMSYSLEELEEIASQLASDLLLQRNSAESRKLADITRAIWAKRSKYATFVS
jgi:hypothetical protein